MAEKTKIQDKLLNIARVNNIELKIFFEGTFSISGYIKSFDEFTVLIEKDGQQTLIYKSSISRIDPMKTIMLFPKDSNFKK